MGHYDGFYNYLPVTDPTIESGAYVTGVGRGVIHPESAYPPEGHPALYQFEWVNGRILPEYAVILVTEGSGEFESKGSGKQRIEADSVILLIPGLWHRYRPDRSTGWTERWISFNGELVHRLWSIGIFQPGLHTLGQDHSNELVPRFDQLLDGIYADPVSNSVSLSMHTMALVTDALEPFAKESESSFAKVTDSVVQEALRYIWSRSHYPLSVDKIAKGLSVKRRTLDRRFSAVRGRSILEEINLCRITRAKRLLAETNIPIKLVTCHSGFTSIERMRLAFLQSEGVPPSEFREQVRKQSHLPCID